MGGQFPPEGVSATLYFWAIVCLVGAVSDAFSGAVAGVWVAAGALAGGLLATLGLPPIVQAAAFVALSAALFRFVRPLVVRQRLAGLARAELLVGKLGSVVDPIDEGLASGRVVVEGVSYVARTAAGRPALGTGAGVRVRSVESGELVVEPVHSHVRRG